MAEIQKTGHDSHPLLRIGVIYNLKRNTSSDDEAEFDNFDTILAIKNALEGENRSVELLEANEELPTKLRESRIDIAFNIAEGLGGRARESQVPAILNYYKIPFTGSDETTLCIALDKALTKRILSSYHIRTPKYKVIRKDEPKVTGRFSFPVIVKPNAEGSSKGITNFSIASDLSELKALVSNNIDMYKQDMLAEEYIPGREFTVGILDSGSDLAVFPPMEVIFKDRESRYSIYSYEVKKNYKELIRYECPAKIPAGIEAEMTRTARKIYEVLNCLDFARIDFRLSPDGRLFFIEINPLPGLEPGYSDFPMIAGLNGLDYTALIRSVLNSALKRYGLNISI